MNKNFKLLISKDGQLYLLAVEDFSMPPSEAVYVVKGKYKLGQGASAVKTAGQNWIDGELSGDSLVALGVIVGQGEKVPAVPAAPARLESCLQALAEAGFVRVRMAGHDVVRQEGTHKYKVTATAPTTLEVAVEEPKEGKAPVKATAANISSFIDVAAVKKSPHLQIVYKLQYDAAKNRLAIGHPQVHFKKAFRFTKGDFVNLAWQ